ncbi:MAG: hypothetical protein AAFR05_07780 [Bacteroidota bacterium]
MDNKNVKYLLALAVCAIWGLLGYRIYQKLQPKSDFFLPPAPITFVAEGQQDSFTLLVNYRDPFLGGKLRAPEAAPAAAPSPANTQVSTRIPRPVNPRQNRPFPQVIYKGLIDLKDGRKVALTTAKSKTFNWETGETFAEMTLLAIYEDSIRIKFQESEKTILKGL